MKTLANCNVAEFLTQAYKTREAFHTLYHAVNVDALRAKYAAEREAADTDEQRAEITDKFKAELWTLLMRDHTKELLAVIGACAFLTAAETAALNPADAIGILTECISDRAVMTFFISAERLAGKSTDGILPMLLLIWQSVSAETISGTVSENNMTEIPAENSASPTSGNA